MQCYGVTASDSDSWTMIANSFVPMDYRYGDPERWYSGLTVQESPVYRLLRWEQRGISTSYRTRTNIRHGPCDDFYWVVVPEAGVYSVRYREEEARARPGQAAVTILDDLCQIHIPLLSAYAFQVPRPELDHRVGPFSDRGTTIDLNSGLGRILQDMIRSTHAEQANLSDREFNAVCDRIAELLSMLSLGDTRPQRAHHARIAAQIRQYVRANVGRGDVRLPAVAHALGWSPRQLRSVLQQLGTTYRDLRQDEALRAARDLLQDPAREEVSIGELATRAGFTPAWFSAAFKARFGETPRDFRRRRLAESEAPGSGREPDGATRVRNGR
ncbi:MULTISPECIES: helix-turn-helix transcriptional regulator [Nocardia]|uniref:helix-turn-helix transcriptional regulator n=1 Tax=Nocardia TaxID=1817 RepID=UPI0013572100|nr:MULTISPECIES: AraC family transcriptional regulator [Nocardia]MBF6209297.1 AraC family transcriptional regulator [Streptomyces gardneri]